MSLSISAAERIVIDDAVLSQQLTTLRSAADRLENAASEALAGLSGGSFGALNGFLAEAMNGMALMTGATVTEAAALTERIHEGVSSGRKIFTTFEDEVAQSFKGNES